MLTLKNNDDQFKPWTKYSWLQAISKYFERPGIASGLSNDFSENPNKSFSMRSQNRNGTIAIDK
tara:strand:+ start:243 stop:434 length:192 start_codon:yes stop_codon:yes gene_type:complete